MNDAREYNEGTNLGKLFVVVLVGILIFVAFGFGAELYTAVSDTYNSATYQSSRNDDILSDPEFQSILSMSVFHDVDMSMSHAMVKHSGDKSLYDECISNGKTLMAFFNPDTQHCVEVMSSVDADGVESFLVRVVKQVKGKFYEITAFSDDWANAWEVEEYLLNGGYMNIPLP